jgi:thiamine biosynthesis lipoprotein
VVAELTFRVMAAHAHVILVDPAPGAEGYARSRLRQLERRWSRFLPGSDISRLNASAQSFMMVSSDTIDLLSTMKHAWRVSNGRYDPTMLSAINAAGYTKSIDGSGRRSSRAGSRPRGYTIADVAIDLATSSVVVPAGIGLDPGGIGKGFAADLVVTELLRDGTGGALVSVGGDLAAAGTPPTAEGWHVAIEDPSDRARKLMTLALDVGGVATSSTLTRTWVQEGSRRHHIIDPTTQTCAMTDLAAVTVIARAGWEAEVHATGALLAGSERVLDYLDVHQLDGLAMSLDGTTYTSPALDRAGLLQGSAA